MLTHEMHVNKSYLLPEQDEVIIIPEKWISVQTGPYKDMIYLEWYLL